ANSYFCTVLLKTRNGVAFWQVPPQPVATIEARCRPGPTSEPRTKQLYCCPGTGLSCVHFSTPSTNTSTRVAFPAKKQRSNRVSRKPADGITEFRQLGNSPDGLTVNVAWHRVFVGFAISTS